jgi:NitT/TauT family transport system substrate-binding protein
VKRSYLLLLILALLAAAAAIVWRFGGTSPQTAQAPAFELRLKWLANAGFVGELYADTYGLYLGEGLHVTVAAGGPDRDALTALLRPNSETWFAVASSDQVLSRIYGGATDLRVVAQIYARSPVRWIYRRSLGQIRGPGDLVGKRIGVATGDNDEAMMRTYLRNNQIQESQVRLVGIQYDFGPFLSGAVDLFPVYSNTQGVELQRMLAAQHEEVAFFDPSVGPGAVPFAANSIVTTSRIVTEHPEVVRAFLRATLRGWEESIQSQNLDRSTRAVIHAMHSASVDDASIAAQVSATRPIVKPSASHRIGTIDRAAWVQTEQTLLSAGQLKDAAGRVVSTRVGIEAYIADQFLPR